MFLSYFFHVFILGNKRQLNFPTYFIKTLDRQQLFFVHMCFTYWKVDYNIENEYSIVPAEVICMVQCYTNETIFKRINNNQCCVLIHFTFINLISKLYSIQDHFYSFWYSFELKTMFKVNFVCIKNSILIVPSLFFYKKIFP